MRIRQLFFVVNILAVASLLVQGGAPSLGQSVNSVILEGTFSVLWGDEYQQNGESSTRYFLSIPQQDILQLEISSNLLVAQGGIIALNQKQVVVQGSWIDGVNLLQVESISVIHGTGSSPQGVYGPQPWVSILCKFADYADEPKDYDYFMGMYADEYPGLDHFWRQNSYDLANLEGSGVFGWYTLPHNREYYIPPGGSLDWWTAAAECTAAADPYVDFTPYVGINLMFNAVLDCCAWGGTWYACLDGVCKSWRTTWEPPWGYENIGVIAHETGHGFGLPHSEGNCHQVYDNRWDVLSDVWSNGPDPVYGTMGQHTISYHKELLGWLTADQVFTATTGTISTITLEKLALPQTENFLGAVIPIDDQQGHFYTLEVRQPSSDPLDYDKWLPGFAVIIHEVIEGEPEPAAVIDLDGDCNTADAGAMYTPGEVFNDAEHGISVSILSATETGYKVTINNDFTPMQGVEISGAEQGYLGESLPFTATVSPMDASSPISYTWQASGKEPIVHVGGVQDTISYTWDEAGTKAITVTASNLGGTVMDTYLISIQQILPIVTLSGPEAGNVGETQFFSAEVEPEEVAQPITYTWQASGQVPITHTGGLSDTVAYVWNDPGTQLITVTATNIFGSTSDTFPLPVYKAPEDVLVNGPTTGYSNETYAFIAEIKPITTSLPLTYVWVIDEGNPITHSAGLVDVLPVSFTEPGLHVIHITVSNPAGIVEGTWTIFIYTRIFMPLMLRN